MPEVSAPHAAEILSTSHPTIFRRVDDGTLPARREGMKREIWIEVDDLRRFAAQNGYRFNEQLADQYAQ
jgi:hypothetical protein